MPFGHPNFGRLLPCRCTQAARETRRSTEALARLGDELGALSDKTFDSFKQDRKLEPFTWRQQQTYSVAEQRAMLKSAVADCVAYADAPRSWLYIYGSVGAGKSHLAAAIGHVRARRGEQVRYRSIVGMLDALKAGFDNGTSDEIFTDLLRCDLLIVDDLGAENLTDWAAERLFRITNERQGLPTVLTSNRHANDLIAPGQMADRVVDRIAGAAATIFLPLSSYRRVGGTQ